MSFCASTQLLMFKSFPYAAPLQSTAELAPNVVFGHAGFSTKCVPLFAAGRLAARAIRGMLPKARPMTIIHIGLPVMGDILILHANMLGHFLGDGPIHRNGGRTTSLYLQAERHPMRHG